MKMNLGRVLDELDFVKANDTFSVCFNPKLSLATVVKLDEAIKKCKEFRQTL